MDAPRDRDTAMEHRTTAERTSDHELVVSRIVRGPARLVFDAFSKPELFRRWWVPKSTGFTLVSCEMDVRTGGTYRLVFAGDIAFFGRYLEVIPPSRIVWSNDESGDGGAVTTVTFEDLGPTTRVVLRDRYPSKEALDAVTGMDETMAESLAQLDELLASLGETPGSR